MSAGVVSGSNRSRRAATACQPHDDVPSLPGHTLTPMVEFYDNDDSSGFARCSCGWEGRSIKTCWIDEQFADHLADVTSREHPNA